MTVSSEPKDSPNLQFLRRYSNSSPQGIAVVDFRGIIIMVNDSLCDSFGYQRQDLLGMSVEALIPHRYRLHHTDLREAYTRKPEVKMMGTGRDLTGLHADGTEFPVEVGLSPLDDESSNTLVTITNITARKALETKLKNSSRSMEEFTYVASHDLRSPLRGIADLLIWIREDLSEGAQEKVEKNLDRIELRVKRMESLIENLLDYAKAGESQHKSCRIDVSSMVSKILNLVDVPDGFNVSIESTVEYFSGVQIPLETVLRNLLSNAVNHHDKKDGMIAIHIKYEGNMVKFSVLDDGPGIPKSAQSRIFNLFQTASSRANNTSGMGLAICRRLTETHGGKIKVESENHLTTFTVWWPRYIRKDKHDQANECLIS